MHSARESSSCIIPAAEMACTVLNSSEGWHNHHHCACLIHCKLGLLPASSRQQAWWPRRGGRVQRCLGQVCSSRPFLNFSSCMVSRSGLAASKRGASYEDHAYE